MAATWLSMYSSRDFAGLAVSTASASGALCPYSASPVRDITEVIDRSRSAWSMASRCTIIPPIESPMTWARSTPTASSTATASCAMSASVYSTPSSFEESPTSRLSNRTTR